MVTCYLRYIVDAYKLKEFEHYGKLWIPLVEKFGGKHHGYFLPSEGAWRWRCSPSRAWPPMRSTAPTRCRTRNARPHSSTRRKPAAS